MRSVLVVSFLVVLGVVGFVWLTRPYTGRSRETARRTKCSHNLKQIGRACHLYAGDNADKRFPPSLGAVLPTYVSDGEIYICPSGGDAEVFRRADLPEGAKDASGVFTEKHTDYLYVAGLFATDPPDLLVAFDKPGNHDSAGRNVLMVSGRVRWMKESEFSAALAKTARQREPQMDTD
jgi:hypothetical protein